MTVRTSSDCTVAPMASFMERSTLPHQVRKAQTAASGASHRGTSGMSSRPAGSQSHTRAPAPSVTASTSRLARM